MRPRTTAFRTLPALLRALLVLPPASLLLPQGPGLLAQELGDAEIAHVAVTANQIDIDAAELALERASDPEVSRFAETMIRDHEGVIAAAGALVDRLGVTPAPNESSRMLESQAEEVRMRLGRLQGSDFDRAYIEHEIAYHEAVIEVVRETLVPGASNPDLEEFLREVLPALEAHLEHARRVSGQLGFDDAEIAHIAVTANRIDITTAELALERSFDEEVRRFAETMIRDHEGVIGEATALVERLGVTPAENEMSSALLAQAEEARRELEGFRDGAFDRAYVEHEIAYHEAVIDAVHGVLLPDASHPDLVGLLETVLPALEAHLEHAQRVRDALENR